MKTTIETSQKFATYSAYAKNWLTNNEIKIKTVYVQDGNYNPYFVYINRIANSGKPKFRILKRNKDNVKNCILITFNTETVNKDYIEYLIQSKLKVIAHLAHGSCQTFINQDLIAQILSGAIGNNGMTVKEVLY